MPAKALAKCHIVMVGSWPNSSWTAENIPKWVARLGGTLQSTVDEDTTHVVASAKAWKDKAPGVAKALKAIKERKQDIKIVSDDWFDDSLKKSSKRREGIYLWERLEGAMTANESEKIKDFARAFAPGTLIGGEGGYQAAQEKATVPKQTPAAKKGRGFAPNGLLGGGKINGTNNGNNNGTTNSNAKDNGSESEASNVSISPASRVPKRPSDNVDPFLRGSKKARNEIFSENHHIYRDATGFAYEVQLTKVDIRTNRNERHAITLNLQLYESNSLPNLYACSVQYAATKQVTSNNILAPIGSPFAVAFRSFKQIFKEKTSVNWDQRINFSAKRKEAEAAGKATGQPGTLAVREDGQWTFLDEAEAEALAFEDRAAEYAVPRFGAVGEVFKSTVQLLREGQLATENRRKEMQRQSDEKAAKEQQERETHRLTESARQRELDEAWIDEVRQEREALGAVETMEQRETLDADEAWAQAREAEMQVPKDDPATLAGIRSRDPCIEGEDKRIREVDGLPMMSGGIRDDDDDSDQEQEASQPTGDQVEVLYDEYAAMGEALAESLAAVTNGQGHPSGNEAGRASLPTSVGGFEADDELSSPVQPTAAQDRDVPEVIETHVAPMAEMAVDESLLTYATVPQDHEVAGADRTESAGAMAATTAYEPIHDVDRVNEIESDGAAVAVTVDEPLGYEAGTPTNQIATAYDASTSMQASAAYQPDMGGPDNQQFYPATDNYEEYNPLDFDYGVPHSTEGGSADWDVFSNMHQGDVQPHQSTLDDRMFDGTHEMFGNNLVQPTVNGDEKPGNDLFIAGLSDAAAATAQPNDGDSKPTGTETQVASQLHNEMMQAAEAPQGEQVVLGKRPSPGTDDEDADQVVGDGKRRK